MIDYSTLRHVHFIGIGGIGMSAIAEIMLREGYKVSGSDMNESEITDKLSSLGAMVYLGHNAKNVKDADLLVFSAAIKEDNPEMVKARENGIQIVSRAQILGSLMQRSGNSIGVAGTHGKTTTTSMLSLVLKAADLEPTILVGGNLGEIGGNVLVGKNDYFITEACEYMDSFLSLCPKYAIILNIDSDHLDYFDGIDHIVSSFKKFAHLVPDDGAVIAYDANPFVKSMLKDLDRPVITFGFHEGCDYCADNIVFMNDGMPSFDVVYKGDTIASVELKIPGEHNICNALAAFAGAHVCGVDPIHISQTLSAFTGTKRRFDVLGDTMSGIKIVDDYAHHPTEIKATIKAARKMPHNKLWILFQPHTYTRTFALHDEFAEALSAADNVVLAEIYAAREKNISGVNSKSIADSIRDLDGTAHAFYIETFEEIAKFVYNNTSRGDLVLTMGAGDIYKIGQMIMDLDRASNLKR
ncbi:MAG: UDP-N-acetylmuramate--L-alanine ligase [Clostridiales Family XIII bacterium]|nr:UDP-N-acetylmuramate--L-alanine ligase [Clostridiales Family XIII bacterium]